MGSLYKTSESREIHRDTQGLASMEWPVMTIGLVTLVLLSAFVKAHRQHESWITISQPVAGAPIEVIHQAHLGDIVTLLDRWSLPSGSLDDIETLARLTLYAADRLTISGPQGQQISPTLVGAEVQDDFLFIYMTLPEDLPPDPIQCDSVFLQDVLPDQVNLVEIDLPWQRQSLRLQSPTQRDDPSF